MEDLIVRVECAGNTTVNIEDLVELHHYGKITDEHYAHGRNSITELGFSFPFFFWESEGKKYTVDGHGRLKILKRMRDEGFTIPPLPADPVFAKDRAEAKKKILAQESRYKDFDEGLFTEFLAEDNLLIEDLENFVDIPDLDADLWKGSEDVVEDEVPEVSQEPAISQSSKVYQLGRHRLMCGNAEYPEQVSILMNGQKTNLIVTDPPYNTGMSKNDEAAWLPHMFKDNLTPEEWQRLISVSLNNMEKVAQDNCVFYIFIDFRNMGKLKEEMEKTLTVSNVIVWDKMVHGLGSDYQFTYELIVVGKKGKPEINNRTGEEYRDVWHLQRDMGRNEDHATAKPLALLAKPLKHASKENDIVLDLFGGSGSTLIACEQTNRTCYMMELDPKYCDVIRKRYHKFITGSEEGWQEGTPCIV